MASGTIREQSGSMAVQRDDAEERQARLDLLVEQARVKTPDNSRRATAAQRESPARRKQVERTAERIRTPRKKRR
jgi:prophage antirepressor-like protein